PPLASSRAAQRARVDRDRPTRQGTGGPGVSGPLDFHRAAVAGDPLAAAGLLVAVRLGQRQMGSVQRRRSGSCVWVLRQRTFLRRPWGARSHRSPVDVARRSKGLRLARVGAVAWVLAGP